MGCTGWGRDVLHGLHDGENSGARIPVVEVRALQVRCCGNASVTVSLLHWRLHQGTLGPTATRKYREVLRQDGGLQCILALEKWSYHSSTEARDRKYSEKRTKKEDMDEGKEEPRILS